MKPVFGRNYWKATSKSRPMTCSNCGHKIAKASYSPTGWTHQGGNWEGVRCQNMLVGAIPVAR
jgi:hypothetical protein